MEETPTPSIPRIHPPEPHSAVPVEGSVTFHEPDPSTPHPQPIVAQPVEQVKVEVQASLSRELKAVLIGITHATLTIAERVDADHEGVQTAIATLRSLQQRIESL